MSQSRNSSIPLPIKYEFPLFFGQEPLIALTRAMNFKSKDDTNGRCSGYSFLGLEACFSDWIEQFNKIIIGIHSYDPLVSRMLQKMANFNLNFRLDSTIFCSFTHEEAELASWIHALEILQHPNLYEEVIGKQARQENGYDAYPVAASSKMQLRGGIIKLDEMNLFACYSKMDGFFSSIKNHFKKYLNQPNKKNLPEFGISLKANCHRISLFYLPITDQWIFIDANQPPCFLVKTNLLASRITRAFTLNHDKNNFSHYAIDFLSPGDRVRTNSKLVAEVIFTEISKDTNVLIGWLNSDSYTRIKTYAIPLIEKKQLKEIYHSPEGIRNPIIKNKLMNEFFLEKIIGVEKNIEVVVNFSRSLSRKLRKDYLISVFKNDVDNKLVKTKDDLNYLVYDYSTPANAILPLLNLMGKSFIKKFLISFDEISEFSYYSKMPVMELINFLGADYYSDLIKTPNDLFKAIDIVPKNEKLEIVKLIPQEILHKNIKTQNDLFYILFIFPNDNKMEFIKNYIGIGYFKEILIHFSQFAKIINNASSEVQKNILSLFEGNEFRNMIENDPYPNPYEQIKIYRGHVEAFETLIDAIILAYAKPKLTIHPPVRFFQSTLNNHNHLKETKRLDFVLSARL